MLKFDVNSNKPDTLVGLNNLNSKADKMKINSMKIFPSIEWETSISFNFWDNNYWLNYDTENGKLKEVNSTDSSAENKTVAPNSKYVAFTKANNLYVSLGEGNTRQISFDLDTNIVNGYFGRRNRITSLTTGWIKPWLPIIP